jgi:hypothetical protein
MPASAATADRSWEGTSPSDWAVCDGLRRQLRFLAEVCERRCSEGRSGELLPQVKVLTRLWVCACELLKQRERR